VSDSVRNAVTNAVDTAKTVASQILGAIKAAGSAVEGAVVRPAAKAVEEVGERLASLGRGGEQPPRQIDARIMRWLVRNIDEPLQRGNFNFAVDEALDVVRTVDRIRELEGRPSLSEAEARELGELRLRAALNNYYKIYDALRELRPSVFEAARARLAEERLAEELRELGGREALDRLRGVLTPEELDSLARNIGKVGRDVLAKAALGDRGALDRLANELGVARDKAEYVAKEWAASHLRDAVEAMDAAEARRLLSDRAELAEMARAFGVKEEDLQAVVEEALEAKMRGAARGGAERGIGRPRLEAEERGAERPEEEGGGKEVKAGEGQALLLKEEAKEEAKQEAKEEGGVRTMEEGGQAPLVAEERPRLELGPRIRLRRIQERAPPTKRVGEEVRRRWFPDVPFIFFQPRYGLGPAPSGFAPLQPVPVSAPIYATAPTYTPYYTPYYTPATGTGPVPSTTPETAQTPTGTPSTTPETTPQLTVPGTTPQQVPQTAPTPAVEPVPTPQPAPQLTEEAPAPIIVGGWPWYPAEGGWRRRYSPGRQRERLVL